MPNDDLYDAFAHARAERGELPILSPTKRARMSATCAKRVLERLPDLDPFLVGMVVQHELQHAETIAQTLVLAGLLGHARAAGGEADGDVVVPGGSFTIGSTDAWAYDNEQPPHAVELPAFRIDRALVTNGEYAAFIEAGGYRDRASGAMKAGLGARPRAEAPLYWQASSRRASRCSTCRSTRPRRMRAGRVSGCRPRPNGRRR